ncbi:TPA: Lar family restriction alleviation protein [Providencia alcalifaciens]|uniref:Lar family restriction alleviation protein n=1 Tax=Providencia alcalifaciens TaxID=126385 RepID=UPI000DD9E21B|nr:hypothetical protein [Providencia alcalifaciens]
MSELKKCPMCGSNRIHIVGYLYKRVSCKNCGTQSVGCSEKSRAIAAWNRRANSE